MGLLLVGVAWFYFNGLPLPMTAADRAALLTGRDLEPWVPGLSAMRGSESFRKRMTFLFGWGVDVEYNFENAREAAVPFSMRCTTTLRGTQEEAAGTFKALSSAGSASLLAVRLAAKLSQPSTPAPSVVERNDLLKWGDASWCITMELEKHFALVFSARRGRHVFTLLIVGPRLEDEVLRKVLLSRLEYLELG
jgi:hypothetical protein